MPDVRLLRGRLHRGSPLSAGFDLFTTVDICLRPGRRVRVPVGVVTAFAPGVVGLIRDRSGLAADLGLTVLAGVIDADYDREWQVVLLNTGDAVVEVAAGSRVAQVLFLRVRGDVEVEGDAVKAISTSL